MTESDSGFSYVNVFIVGRSFLSCMAVDCGASRQCSVVAPLALLLWFCERMLLTFRSHSISKD
jgi:hypothetical protein